jgi:hypothetical protein
MIGAFYTSSNIRKLMNITLRLILMSANPFSVDVTKRGQRTAKINNPQISLELFLCIYTQSAFVNLRRKKLLNHNNNPVGIERKPIKNNPSAKYYIYL